MALAKQSSRQQLAGCRAVVEHRDMTLEVVIPPSPFGGALPTAACGQHHAAAPKPVCSCASSLRGSTCQRVCSHQEQLQSCPASCACRARLSAHSWLQHVADDVRPAGDTVIQIAIAVAGCALAAAGAMHMGYMSPLVIMPMWAGALLIGMCAGFSLVSSAVRSTRFTSWPLERWLNIPCPPATVVLCYPAPRVLDPSASQHDALKLDSQSSATGGKATVSNLELIKYL